MATHGWRTQPHALYNSHRPVCPRACSLGTACFQDLGLHQSMCLATLSPSHSTGPATRSHQDMPRDPLPHS